MSSYPNDLTAYETKISLHKDFQQNDIIENFGLHYALSKENNFVSVIPDNLFHVVDGKTELWF